MTVHVRRKGAVPLTTVESDKELGKEYEIARLPTGNLACACMAYVFNKDTPKTCKHIEAYLSGETQRVSVAAQEKAAGYPTPVASIERIKVAGETFTFKPKRSISFNSI